MSEPGRRRFGAEAFFLLFLLGGLSISLDPLNFLPAQRKPPAPVDGAPL